MSGRTGTRAVRRGEEIVVARKKPHIVPARRGAWVGDQGGGPAPLAVWLAGCGGTGAILAEHLARMISGYRLRCLLFLVDGDAVEEANLARQQFLPEELGVNKAEALATRLSAQLAVPLSAVCRPLGEFPACADEDEMPTTHRGAQMACDLLITATDSLHSRRLAAEMGQEVDGHGGRWRYWLDVGNEAVTGQAILGTTHDAGRLAEVHAYWDRHTYCPDLPDAAAVNPAMLKARPGRREASCATMPFSTQGFGVNAAAALAAACIAKQVLVDGQVTTPQIWFDVAAGRMLPKAITRELYQPWAKPPTAGARPKSSPQRTQRTRRKAKAKAQGR
jgi:hypothetical protein